MTTGTESPRFGRSSIRGPGLLLILPMLVGIVSSAGAESVTSLEKELKKALLGGTAGQALSAVDSLADLGTAPAMRSICKYAFTADNEDVERGAIVRLRRVQEEAAVAELAKLANKSKDFRVRICLTFALATHRSSVAFTAVVQNVFDPRNTVALAALESIQKSDNLGAVLPLIDALAQEEKKGRATDQRAYVIRKTLTSLTNEDFEVSDDWRNFWKNRGPDYERPAKGDRTKEVSTYVRRESVDWFGIEVNTKRFVFVLDVSGSMKKKDPMPEGDGSTGRGKGKGGTTGVGPDKPKPKPKPEDIPESRQRLKRVQAELIRVIAKLPKDMEFGIVVFNHEIQSWQDGKLVRSTPANKTKAIKFVKDFKAEGTTQTDEALLQAFSYNKINTIFLLSDGAPRSRDDVKIPTAPILDWVRKENRFRRIRINAITFEQCGKSLRAFMRKLATRTKGQYKELR